MVRVRAAATLVLATALLTVDPRDLDLPVSVEDRFELAEDPRVDGTTTQEAVDGDRDLDYRVGPDQ